MKPQIIYIVEVETPGGWNECDRVFDKAEAEKKAGLLNQIGLNSRVVESQL